MEPVEMVDAFREVSGAFELYQVIGKFTGHRHCKGEGGADKEITIEVLDRGPSYPSDRFMVEVVDKDGRIAGGSTGETVDVAMQIAHWEELDKPLDQARRVWK